MKTGHLNLKTELLSSALRQAGHYPFSIINLKWLTLRLPALSQTCSIDWYKVAGGGGTSTGGVYAVNGTIGQSDAGAPISGADYSLTGGFWSLISVVETAGLPNLTITQVRNHVTISWQNTGSYTLQQNANLAPVNGWATSGYSVSTSNRTNSITVAPPTGNLFFRLKQ